MMSKKYPTKLYLKEETITKLKRLAVENGLYMSGVVDKVVREYNG